MPALVLAQTMRLRGARPSFGGGRVDDRKAAPVDEGPEDAAIAEARQRAPRSRLR